METKIVHCDLCHTAIRKNETKICDSHDGIAFYFYGPDFWTIDKDAYNRLHGWQQSNSSKRLLCQTCYSEYLQLISAFVLWLQKRTGTRMPNIVVTDKGVEVTPSVNTDQQTKQLRRIN